MYNRKLNITEEESRQIRKLYGMNYTDYVFDFVLTENHKYLILMDNVFVNGGDGNSIGSIWDNTHIFNEIIKENFTKLGLIVEDTSKELIDTIDNLVWKKEFVRSVINSKDPINEGLWDDIKKTSGNLLKQMGQSTINAAAFVLKQGVVPFLQWVRRGLYTSVGIVIDVVVSILAVKSSAIAWLLIALLDVYEIITGNFDEKDPDRQKMPYFFLGCDLLGALFTGAVALPIKKTYQAVAKNGIKALTPNMKAYFVQLGKKIPSLISSLKNVGNLLITKMPTAKGIVNVILSGVDKILGGLQKFIHKLLSVEGLKAGAIGGAVLGVTKGVEAGIDKIKGKGNGGDMVKSQLIDVMKNNDVPYVAGVDY